VGPYEASSSSNKESCHVLRTSLLFEGKTIHDGCLGSEPLLIRGIGWLSISLLLINQYANRIRVLK